MPSNLTMPARGPLQLGVALATLAHELRDPINSVLLALEGLSGDADPPARQAVAMAVRQARRAARIIDDLFDLCAGSLNSLRLRVRSR